MRPDRLEVEDLARFVAERRFEDLSPAAIERLKLHILDSIGVGLGALGARPLGYIRELIDEFGGKPLSTVFGHGRTAPDRAAFLNGALIRYLDFNDSYLTPGETFHPSDNLAAILAASEWAEGSGKDLLAALAIAYEVQIRLSEAAPVRHRGFDHTTQGAYAAAAGAAKALRLSESEIAHAIAMNATANNALRVTRTGDLSHWKGLAYPYVAMSATFCAGLASRGITGPLEVFEGNKGFHDTIAGPFHIDWASLGLNGILQASLKKYNAEFHSQSAIEALLEIRERLKPAELGAVDRIEVRIFQVAYDIIGGGEEGPKRDIRTKEEADHSLLYILAVALLDGQVLPAQYDPLRIAKPDVQNLLRKVSITADPSLSASFPARMPVRVSVFLTDGRRFDAEKSDYEGFHTRPMSWALAEEKFHALAAPRFEKRDRDEVIAAIRNLENLSIRDLMELL